MLIPELTHEMDRQQCPEYIDSVRRLVSVEGKIRNAQLDMDREPAS